MQTTRVFFGLFSVLALATAATAAGYIKIGDIKGESRADGHKDWIEILSVAAPDSSTRDAASGMATGKRQHKPITITKRIDKASPKLAEACTSKKTFAELTISQDGVTYTLANASVASVTPVDATTEQVSFSYTKISQQASAPSPAVAQVKGQPTGRRE